MGCASRTYMNKYERKEVKQFKNILVMEPIVYIQELDDKYQKRIYDYDSEIKDIFKKTYQPHLESIQSNYLDLDSTKYDQAVLINLLIEGFKKDIIDSSLTSALRNNNKGSDKILILEIDGWFKSKELVKWEGTKTVLWAICTLGTYVPIYYEHTTSMSAVMIDLSNNKVIYKENYRMIDDPRLKETIEKLIRKTIW